MGSTVTIEKSGSKKYAFVLPRFGEGIIGGAETLVGALAEKLNRRGDKVEIFTTCARDNRTWENEFEGGTVLIRGVPVTRFAVDPRNLSVWIERQLKIHDGLSLGVDEELAWMRESVNSAALYGEIALRADEFDAFFFGPYLFGTTFWGSLTRPDKSYLIPCLHDECYAYTEVVGSMFRQVSGALFNAAPEQELANMLYGTIQGGEVGMGFESLAEEETKALLPYFAQEFPYILCAGRKETGKNVSLLIDYFVAVKDNNPRLRDVKLVIAGGGSFDDLKRSETLLRGDIVDLAQVSEHDKKRLMRHALFVCQPSVNESFSIVLMEAWLLGTPVVVHANCPVTKHHVLESGGGLYFNDSKDFEAALWELLESRKLREELAESGRDYVHHKYNWPAVLARFDGVMAELLK